MPIETRDVTFYLFRITPPEGMSTLGGLFEPILKIPEAPKRSRIIKNDRITLSYFEQSGGMVRGKLDRCQPGTPEEFLSDKTGQERPIAVNPETEEGITGRTHFLYVPERDIIVLQGGKRRVTAGMLRSLLCGIAKVEEAKVFIQAMVTQAQYETYRSMSEITALSFQVASPDTGLGLAESGETTENVLKWASQHMGAMTFAVKLTHGSRKNPSMTREGVFGAVEYLRSLKEKGIVRCLRVTGAPTDDDPLQEIDLLEERMRYVKKIPIDDRGPRTYECFVACEEAYNYYLPDIKLYSAKNEVAATNR